MKVVVLCGILLCYFSSIANSEIELTYRTRNNFVIDSTGTPTVTIANGIVKGITIKADNGKNVYAFYGIPFANPPVDSLKFKKPVPYTKKWDTPYEAFTLPNSCTQLSAEMFPNFRGEQTWNPNTKVSDDCLYLNVWVSEDTVKRSQTSSLPVLFWIYGGGYYSGSSTLELYNGVTMASEKDLVIVSSQYRLGPHGFLYFDHEEAPGNVGMLDQVAAMHWTNKNIQAFGGNPNEVVLFGESCGAASVSYHLLSPLSQKLFKRAILLSGVATADWAFNTPEDSLEMAYSIAEDVECIEGKSRHYNIRDIVQCLRQVPGEVLHKVMWKYKRGILNFSFVPTVDNYFLPDEPKNLIHRWDLGKKDLLIGTVKDEGTYFQLYYYLQYFNPFNVSLIPYDGFVSIMRDLFKSYSPIEQEAILFYYTNWINLNDGYKNQELIGEAIGDAFFNCPVRDFADKWSSRGGLNVFYYYFTEHTESDPWAKWMGVKHGDEIGYFFGQPLNASNSDYTTEERNLSHKIVNMLYKFMETGKPSENWAPYTASVPRFLNLNGSIISDETRDNIFGPRADKCAFWNAYLPSLRKQQQRLRCTHPSPDVRITNGIGDENNFCQG